MALGQVVINRYGVSGIEQFLNANGTDIARAASDKSIHPRSLLVHPPRLNVKTPCA